MSLPVWIFIGLTIAGFELVQSILERRNSSREDLAKKFPGLNG